MHSWLSSHLNQPTNSNSPTAHPVIPPSSSPAMPGKVIIIGGGCFGLSTALELVKGEYKGHGNLITVLDRSSTPPAADAASSDYNKIVRQDYCDETWAKLASEAIREWSTPEWAPYFAQSGVLVLSQTSHAVGAAYVRNAYNVNSHPSMALDGRLAVNLPTPSAIKGVFGNDALSTAEFTNEVAYINPQSGWALARRAMDMVCEQVRKAGVRVMGGEVDSLMYDSKGGKKDVTGVRLVDGRSFSADKVVVAAGSWSAKFLPEIGKELLASGQAVAHIQLTPEEAAEYAHVPVVFRMDTGFYIFPPTPDGIVKFAIHGPGWINPTSHNGHPIPSIPKEGHYRLPQEAIQALKINLANTYPELAKKEWFETRLCWCVVLPSLFTPRNPLKKQVLRVPLE
ncbi:FAD dependent oxidoreductase [Papiliotrema laurentii]|uniref:FAD dependent oxidoreductase n=1 Tax=Papiliotrema laurentii TaxID=5418 RepID=A0AAD9L940_PAPLA|nr:FAD dependent oxidoreductase [Papiliotrema laurentii]